MEAKERVMRMKPGVDVYYGKKVDKSICKEVRVLPPLKKGDKGIIYGQEIEAFYCPKMGKFGAYFVTKEAMESIIFSNMLNLYFFDKGKSIRIFGKTGLSILNNGLKEKSILKMNGYSVSETDHLSEEQRHATLKRIIEEKILSKDRVVEYLDFFIEQKKGLDALEPAINKWKKDKEWVLKNIK